MGELLRGRLALPAYRAMLHNLRTIYVALEGALEARQRDPHVAPVHMPELYRAQALASDLQALGMPAHGAETAIALAAAADAQRLAQIAHVGSPALVAHA